MVALIGHSLKALPIAHEEESRQAAADISLDALSQVFGFLDPKDLSTAARVNHEWHDLASSNVLWGALLRRQQVLPGVRVLDGNPDIKAAGFPLADSSTISQREILKTARRVCKASENGRATVLTIPAGWSLEKLQILSKKAVAAGIPSATIFLCFANEADRALITPIQIKQTVVLTDTVIPGSRGKSAEDQGACLKAAGFGKEFPDALTVLTMAVLVHIVAEDRRGLYDDGRELATTLTRCAQRTPSGHYLYVGSTKRDVCVYDDNRRICNKTYFGAGAFCAILQ